MKAESIRVTILAALVAACGSTLLTAGSSSGADDRAVVPNVAATDQASSGAKSGSVPLIVDGSDQVVAAIKGMTIETRSSVAARIESSRKAVHGVLADLRKQALKTPPKVQVQLVELLARVDGANDDLKHDLKQLLQADATDVVSLRDELVADYETFIAQAQRAQECDLQLK